MTAPGPEVAAALGRLVSLVRFDAPETAQQAALQRLQTHNRLHGVRLTLADGVVRIDGHPLTLPATADLVEQMAAHAVRVLEVHPSADATELMAVARALAAEADVDAPGAAFRVRFPPHVGRTVRVELPEAPAPASDTAHRRSVLDGAVALADGRDTYLAFGHVATPTMPLHELFRALDAAATMPAILNILDALAVFGEAALRDERLDELVQMLDGAASREAWESADDRRRAIAGLLRKFRSPKTLGRLAPLLARGAPVREATTRVLAAAGTLGADAIIDALVAATERPRRRAFLDALREVPVAAGSLSLMLGDPRWFVVRNAAYLIGELRLAELESALFATRTHADERVRLAVFTALGKLGTSRAIGTLQSAIRDQAPAIRRVAASVLGAVAPERAIPIARAALEVEADLDVRIALLGALGQVDHEDAVALLAEAAAPGGWLLRRKPTRLRLAAVQALQHMSQPAAREVLAALARDREPDIRAAAAAPPPPKRRASALAPMHEATGDG